MTAVAVEQDFVLSPPHGQPERPVIINPLQEPNWDSLLAAHPDAGFYHGTAWARVLTETYGHVPAYVASLDGGGLSVLPIMEVSSPLTGRRGVGLPFTDYCGALKSEGRDPGDLYRAAMEHGRARGWRYLEMRQWDGDWENSSPSVTFHGHVLDLEAGEDALFENLESSVRRGIRKAESAGLKIEFANSLEAVETYYGLHCRTRRKHGVPPQPFRFFANIQRRMLQQDLGFVALARWEGKPIAGAIFFQQGQEAIYKFGASDMAFQNLRPNNLVMWEGIRHCVDRGCAHLHFGRTSLDNAGLRRYKLGFGAREEEIKYRRFDFHAGRFVTSVDRAEGWVNRVFACLPPPLFRLAGRMLYPHLT